MSWNIQQSKNPNRLLISFPFNRQHVDLVKAVPDRKWDPNTKTWSIPSKELSRLVQALTYHKIPHQISSDEIHKSLVKIQQKESILLSAKSDTTPFEVPGLISVPEPHQYAAIKWLSLAQGAILADDMGLGKTLMSLSASLRAECTSALVMTLSTIKWHWNNEIEKHTNETCVIIEGDKKKRLEQWNTPARFYICGFESLLTSDWEIIKEKRFPVIIADEARKVKGYSSLTTKALKKLKPQYKFALTGTPIENNLDELWSVMDWVQPGLLGSRWSFLEKYAKKDFFGKVIGYRPERFNELQTVIAPYLLRREETRLAKPQHVPCVVEFNEQERREYNKLVREIWDEMKDQPSAGFTFAIRAKQYTSLPSILGYASDGPKIRELKNLVDLESNHKYVIFSEFIASVKRIAALFDAPYITGDEPKKKEDRQAIIDQFNNDPTQKVLVCSNVTSFGVEITSADVIIHLDTPWNPAVKAQRDSRVNRHGQQRAVKSITVLVKNSLDDRIQTVVSGKINLAKSILDGIDDAVLRQRLTKQDWRRMMLGDES